MPFIASSSCNLMVSPSKIRFNNSSLSWVGKVKMWCLIGKGISNHGWSLSISGIPVISRQRVNIPTISFVTPAPTALIYLVSPPLDPSFDLLQDSLFSDSNYFIHSKSWFVSSAMWERNSGSVILPSVLVDSKVWFISPSRRSINILKHIGWVDVGLGYVPLFFIGCDGILISSAPTLFYD